MNELGWSLDVLVAAQGSDWCGTALSQIPMEKACATQNAVKTRLPLAGAGQYHARVFRHVVVVRLSVY